MAGKGCCGENELPKVLTDTMLVNAELVDTVLGKGTDGEEVKAGDCLATCRDVAELAAAIKAGDDAERAHSDAGDAALWDALRNGDAALNQRIDDLANQSAAGDQALNDRIDGLANDLAASKNYNQGTNLPGDATDCSRPITACGVTNVLGNKDTPQAQAVRNLTLDTLGTPEARDKLISDDEGNVIESRSNGLYVSRSAVSAGGGAGGAAPAGVKVVEYSQYTLSDGRHHRYHLHVPGGMWIAFLHQGDWFDANGNIQTVRDRATPYVGSGENTFSDFDRSVKYEAGVTYTGWGGFTPGTAGPNTYRYEIPAAEHGYVEVYVASNEAMTDRQLVFKGSNLFWKTSSTGDDNGRGSA